MTGVIELAGVSVIRAGQKLLDDVDWSVEEGDRWVVLGPNGAGRWREHYDDLDHERAGNLLEEMGIAALADRTFGTLSEGERKRVQIARALMADPELLLLDEPAAGLDLGGREDLVDTLSVLAYEPTSPATVLVSHHVEEIPPGFTHVLLLRGGRVVAAGPLESTLTEATLSETFAMHLELKESDGRWHARRRVPAHRVM
jgi:iron complex transport system ATP-binding protein